MQSFAGERAEHLLDRFARDMFEGIGLVDGVFEVEAGGRGSQHQVGDVLFLLGLQSVRHFGRLADADQQDARCERVERPGVADLDFRVAGLRRANLILRTTSEEVHSSGLSMTAM